jgi:hypothetical protein
LRNPPDGLFTRSFVNVVESELSSGDAESAKSLQLQDAFYAARALAAQKSKGIQIPLLKGSFPTPFAFSTRRLNDLITEAGNAEQNARFDSEALRPFDAVLTTRALDLIETALALQPDSREAKHIRANMFLQKDDLAAASQIINEEIEKMTVSDHSLDYQDWMLSSCELKKRQGDLQGAIHDCENAFPGNNATRDRIALLGLYFSMGRYWQSVLLGSQLFGTRYRSFSSVSDDELAHATLLTYLALRLTGNPSEAEQFLKPYSESADDFDRRPILKLSHVEGEKHSLSLVCPPIHAPWFRTVVEYFNDPKADATRFDDFFGDTLPFDRKDASSYECIHHFSVGMHLLLGESLTESRKEFQEATVGDRKQYIEYWIAKRSSQAL